jgi:MFS superfamily sulfate permease-like transporter
MFSTLNKDFRSGLAVFLVAVPLCLWIALASGAPAISGLLAGIIGGIVVWFLSKSSLSVSGPAAWLVAIVIAAISKIGFDGFLIALVIAWILQMLFGVFKLAKYAHYGLNGKKCVVFI